jgi:UDP-galactopyranose mutase
MSNPPSLSELRVNKRQRIDRKRPSAKPKRKVNLDHREISNTIDELKKTRVKISSLKKIESDLSKQVKEFMESNSVQNVSNKRWIVSKNTMSRLVLSAKDMPQSIKDKYSKEITYSTVSFRKQVS